MIRKMNNKIKEYSDLIILEQKKVFRTAPRDNIDWALVTYLFMHSKPMIGGLFEEKNIITVGKISNFFNLEYDEVYKRLRRMIWWVNVNEVYGYNKVFNSCSITWMGTRAVVKTLEIFEVKDKKKLEESKEINVFETICKPDYNDIDSKW